LVHFDVARTSAEALVRATRASTWSEWPEQARRPESSWPRAALGSVVLLGALTNAFPAPLVIGAVAFTAVPTMRRALRALARGELTVDTLDVAALVASLATAQYGTAALITWLLTAGDLLLERSAGHARSVIASLMRELEVCDAWRVGTGVRVERV